ARWRSVNVLTVGTGAVERCELFDESDLDAALAIFDEISCPTMRWQNAASRVGERLRAAFAVRDWPAMTELVSDDLYNEDRRRIVNAGIRHGRDSMIEDMRAAADIGIPRLEAIDIATRGERLVLVRAASRHSERPDAFRVENLVIVELGANGRCAAQIMFDPDDLDAAFAELDARYLAGEAAAHAHTWSAIVNANAAFNRREMPATTLHWVNVDNRRGGMAFAPGDQTAYMHATWDVAPLVSNRIVAVHRLDDRGVAFTQFVQASSRDGFNAEWRDVVVMTFDGELINRCEVFDEDDIDTALSRFDELSASPRSPDTVDT
ncbi:MAG TPA: hypothetical protein VMS92_25260, partial [Mycobacterium sp.]|nr:hypothetical protein [Mycobacterium sp.]